MIDVDFLFRRLHRRSPRNLSQLGANLFGYFSRALVLACDGFVDSTDIPRFTCGSLAKVVSAPGLLS